MSWTTVTAARLRGLIGRTRSDWELGDEVRFHLEMQMEENLKAGMDPAEARYSALRSFGAVESMKEEYRGRRGFALVEATGDDFHYALRTLRKNPGFTITAVAVLALAIGGNTAMFSVLNAVLLRPLPYSAPEQLAMLWSEDAHQNAREGRTAWWNIEQWRSLSRSFVDMAFFDHVSITLTTADRAEQIGGVRTTPNLFSILGVRPVQGRVFTSEEAGQRQPVALISYRFWQNRFGGSANAIGSTIHLNGVASTIVGILPAYFQFDPADVWEPHTMYPNWSAIRGQRGRGFWAVIGRLRPNVTVDQAQSEMNTIARRLDEQVVPSQRTLGIGVMPLTLHVVGEKPRLALWMLTAAVFLVLLIAAVNVASLSLARSAGREREIAIRAALGASRARILRQLLAESLTLTVIAGALGLAVAHACLRLVVAVEPGRLARLNDVRLDPYALGCALALCLVTGMLAGLAPAITMARYDLRSSGQRGGRGASVGVGVLRTRRALVVTEFALAVTLLIGAGLLIRSYWSARNVDLGFSPERVLSVSLAPPVGMAEIKRAEFYRRVIEAVQALPGVESAGITSELFVSSGGDLVVTAEGDMRTVSGRLRFRSDELSEGLFETIRTRLLSGRFFSVADGRASLPVAIINEAMARQLWPGRDATGARFKIGSESGPSPWFTVVGVVADMRREGLERDPIPQMFEPLPQNPPRRAILLVRTFAEDPLGIAASVQNAVRRVETYAPVYAVSTLERQLRVFLAPRRFQTSLLIGFAVIALLIAAIGIYGLIRYSIAMRTREIGIRIAVGAQSGQIFRMIVGEGLKLTLSGWILGLIGALFMGRAASSLLFGVSAADPATFITVSFVLIATAVAACSFPARRAMRVEPIVALRQE